ncbi:MAG: bifunctional D-glycero-beta-D-manno-heptose-7-phosphate kinase/D-glycero-beta-D-manno-heptose 1-phosphate adenylyltransferase HldE [Proteobacteria bacterium]|nr:bifunctional D-glycero-beta-D-manno-heptose-7-phosphate kinase/D-glycero-beta-D-manno-heptose 1-phosphate adenylyltransferase HldE [Pseudomonadota bacterium]
MDPRLSLMRGARVMVVGDLLLDRYWYGATRRISPEAPVPVVLVDGIEERVGGAANVAANAAALEAEVLLVGIAGEDAAGERLKALCREAAVEPIFAARAGHETVVKLRVVSQHQQLVRLDFERPAPPDLGDEVAALVKAHLERCNVVVVSDYAKGATSRVEQVIAGARAAGKRVIVDPKGVDFSRYAGASLVTPNLHEFEAVVGACADDADLVRKAEALCQRFDFEAILVTRGEAGMSLVRPGHAALHLEARSRDVFDVTGAGDTVCAVTAVALAAGHDLANAVALANVAAGVVVGKFGAANVSIEELDVALTARDSVRRGVLTLDELLEERAQARRRGEIVVMTNGCFDILHEGHVRYLREAKALGTRLAVAVNDDASVAALKGTTRPLNPLASRMCVLSALDVVDWVVPFSGETPRELIARVLPDVLVKGGDYAVDAIAGAAEVTAAGGRVTTVAFHDGFSTTALVERITGPEIAS